MLQKKIEKILSNFGINLKILIVDETTNYKQYDVFFANKYNINIVLKYFNYAVNYLKLNIEICKPKNINCDFSFKEIFSNKNKIVCFNDKKYDFIFDKNLCTPYDIFFGVTNQDLPIVKNINEMPHILIAGTTGSGKSVSVNSIICSILKSKANVKFKMIDTKIVELSLYKNLPNCDVATNVEDALELLQDIDLEIYARDKFMEEYGYKTMPDFMFKYIVIIEELADLMFASKKEVEKYIVKIAQLGRACGIHLICCTQRPTVNVITGLIKANIGCRLALKTTSAIDSRVIIDESGAENLKGKGDCLLKLPEKSETIHIQCPYISDDEIRDIIKLYKGEKL